MHYIHFLRPPRFRASRTGPPTLELLVAVTTDLGDATMDPGTPVDLSVTIEHTPAPIASTPLEPAAATAAPNPDPDPDKETRASPPVVQATIFQCEAYTNPPDKRHQRRPPRWSAGMRVLHIDAPVPTAALALTMGGRSQGRTAVCVRPADRRLALLTAADVISCSSLQRERIVPIWAEMPPPPGPGGKGVAGEVSHASTRRLYLGGVDGTCLEIEEEVGVSIIRHVWDAGIMTVAALAETCLGSSGGGDGFFEGELQSVVRELVRSDAANGLARNVLELGAGVGILGLGIATIMTILSSSSGNKDGAGAYGNCSVLMTDLPDAQELTENNIARFHRVRRLQMGFDDNSKGNDGEIGGTSNSSATWPDVRFEALDWEDGARGDFGPLVRSKTWDLVVVSDCTYNIDTLPALVGTLSALHVLKRTSSGASKANAASRVFLSTKPRHDSEAEFPAMMAQDGWTLRQKQGSPANGQGDERPVEFYLFDKTG